LESGEKVNLEEFYVRLASLNEKLELLEEQSQEIALEIRAFAEEWAYKKLR